MGFSFLKVPGKDGVLKTMSEAIDDMDAYSHLTDDVLTLIEVSTDPNLRTARELLQRVKCRQLYKFIGETQPREPTQVITVDQVEHKFPREIMRLAGDFPMTGNSGPVLGEKDFVFFKKNFSYGMKNQDPVRRTTVLLQSMSIMNNH